MEAIARAKAIAAKLNMNLDSGGTKKRGRWGDGGPEEGPSYFLYILLAVTKYQARKNGSYV